jgi:hypothetical protein
MTGGSQPVLARPLAALALGVTVLASAPAARADEKQACVNASEKAQQLRNASKLTEAREQLVICQRSECPKVIQQDCTQWMSELIQVMPTVIPAAKDKAGRDLLDVHVTMDQKPVTDRLDGQPIAMDPGVHQFRFETKGTPAIEQQVVVRPGEKNRILTITFPIGDDAAGGSTVTAPPSGAKPPKDEVVASDDGKSGPPILGFALGAAGLVVGGIGLVVGLNADSDGRTLRDTCAPKCAQSDVDDVKNRQNLGLYLGIGGGVLFAAGVALVIVHYATSGPSKSSSKASLPSFLVPAPGGAAVRF